MRAETSKDVHRILTENRRVVDRAFDRAIRKAILHHKKDRLPLAMSCDGRVLLIQPEDIEVQELDMPNATSTEGR
ncbi:MAG: hypothetical protein AB7P99_14765 [Vicinamibacterales bacterium]